MTDATSATRRALAETQRSEPHVRDDDLRPKRRDLALRILEGAARQHLKAAVGQEAAQRPEKREIIVNQE